MVVISKAMITWVLYSTDFEFPVYDGIVPVKVCYLETSSGIYRAVIPIATAAARLFLGASHGPSVDRARSGPSTR
ncbi:MAG: hypothetical protein EBT06_10305 [Gammaproteobacteria bacterium]|nr:hypothetical protein [Gammaproteobacteria bacterium]